MYRWYENAISCYTFHSDVKVDADFERSRWFLRGWTLQELIAPEYVVFLNQQWEEIGTKASLKKRITSITGIPEHILVNEPGVKAISIAQIMSFAAERQTTRQEDIAYGLLGLFRVNMPMIYGEGMKAFRRLQYEIIKTYDDRSIFAWTASATEGSPFARSPAAFASSDHIGPIHDINDYSVTNRGLRIKLRIKGGLARRFKRMVFSEHSEFVFPAYLGPQTNASTSEEWVGIYITRSKHNGQANMFSRCSCHTLKMESHLNEEELEVREFYLEDHESNGLTIFAEDRKEDTSFKPFINTLPGFQVLSYGVSEFGPRWTGERFLLQGYGTAAIIFGEDIGDGVLEQRFAVVLGIVKSIWSDIRADIGKNESINDVIDLYDKHERACCFLDRVSRYISDDVCVKVALKRTGRQDFVVEVTMYSDAAILATSTRGLSAKH